MTFETLMSLSTSSATSFTFTPAERAAIHEAISAATTAEEMERLERFLREGKVPPEVAARLHSNGSSDGGAAPGTA